MSWYHYVACFFSGVFLSNMVPHFVNGTSGNRFPTPFAKPPGCGLSSPLVNVIWAMVNLTVGYLLFNAGHVSNENHLSVVVFASGLFLMSIFVSKESAKKNRE